jgi:hypothetical protein
MLDTIMFRINRKISSIIHNTSSAAYLGYPTFGMRILDRHARWSKFGRPEWLKSTDGKKAGQDYVESLGYSIPQVYDVYDHISKLPPLSMLPSSFVLKPVYGHSSNHVFVMKNGVNLFDGNRYSQSDIISDIEKQESGSFLIEELLENYDGTPGIPLDFKFYCFGPDVVFVHVIQRKSASDRNLNRHWFLTENWSPLHMRIKKLESAEPDIPEKPLFFPEMLRMAQTLGDGLNAFMRIDLYATTRGPVFGEFTPFPNKGRGYTPEADAWLGSLWHGTEGAGERVIELPSRS